MAEEIEIEPAKKPSIVIEVSGGCVTVVMSNVEMDVTLRDWDNIDAGDPDPLAEFANANGDAGSPEDTDWQKAGYPYEVY